jgi:beta-lactamase class A
MTGRTPTTPLPRTLGLGLALVAAGFVAGYATRDALRPGQVDRAAFTQRREGGFQHINPLLECDLAEDVLRNRELAPFKERITAYLEGRMDPRWASSVSVYFRELNDGLWFSVGDTERYAPASLRKVPLMIALLKAADGPAGRPLLEREVPFDLSRDYNQDQNLKPSRPLVPGQRYRVRELIERMIVQSDNNAFTLLARVVDPAELDRVYALLRMQNPRAIGDDAFLSVQTYASFFRVLYNATYLSKEASEWALATLARSEFRVGLVAGVPSSVPVAHKFGEKSDAKAGAVQLHDCGIVYYPNHPYLLCVMSQGPSFEFLDDVIVAVSRLVYVGVAGQHQQGG